MKATKLLPYDEKPRSLGGHLKKRRLTRNLLQREAAHEIGINPNTYLDWERDGTSPPITNYPAIIAFLGYIPFSEPKTLADQLLHFRREHGLTISEAANRIGVDEGTWGRWEKGITPVYRKHTQILAALFATPLSKIIN